MSKEYTSLGMMSGTSGDGIDASIIVSDGYEKFDILKEKYYKYENTIHLDYLNLKKRINTFKDLELNRSELNELEKKITIYHAQVIDEISNDINIDLIGFHGQTIYHNPSVNLSLQLGNGKLLSQLIKKNLIFNFRSNDIKNGGEGAPLTPIFHKILLKKIRQIVPVGILNIGGISNFTFIEDYKNDKIYSSDIGPGNCLVDQWIQSNTNNFYDDQGKISSRGKVNQVLLESALESYENIQFRNKTFDISDFNISFARGLSIEDGAATIIEYTAKIISSSLNSFLEKHKTKYIDVLICGGGRKNKYLINKINSYSSNKFKLVDIDKFKVNGDFIESQAFAYLAIRSYLNLPITFPKTTGCNKPISGGELIKY